MLYLMMQAGFSCAFYRAEIIDEKISAMQILSWDGK